MRWFIVSVSVLALFCVPRLVRAESIHASQVPITEGQSKRLTPSALVDFATSEASDYAKREAATPKLGEFEGGGGGIYIGGGVITAVLLVVLIVLLVH